jgi:Uncharacterized protein conserved in bacteria (DUF2188)
VSGLRAPGTRSAMPDVTVHPHGDRWAVAEAGSESPTQEYPTREAAESAARQLAAGGAVVVLDEDPTSLSGDRERRDFDSEHAPGAPAAGASPADKVREEQGGL